MVHYAFAEQLLDLARLGINFMQPGTAYAKNDILYSQIAANVYLGFYNCIRTGKVVAINFNYRNSGGTQ